MSPVYLYEDLYGHTCASHQLTASQLHLHPFWLLGESTVAPFKYFPSARTRRMFSFVSRGHCSDSSIRRRSLLAGHSVGLSVCSSPGVQAASPASDSCSARGSPVSRGQQLLQATPLGSFIAECLGDTWGQTPFSGT